MSPRKIVFFLESFRVGGAERNFVKLANGLSKQGYQVDFVVVNAIGPLIDLVSPEVEIVDFGLKSPYRSFLNFGIFIKHRKPNIIISTLDLVNIIHLFLVRLLQLNVKSIIRIANTTSKQQRSKIKKLIEKVLVTKIYPWADEIIAVSQGVANDLSSYTGIPKAAITVMYNPVITPELIEASYKKVDHPWLDQSQVPVILAVGRLDKSKNFTLLVRSFHKLINEVEAHLIILGEGEERPQLEALVNQLGLEHFVEMPGFVENPYSYMRAASAFVLSSIYEGLPAVLIEALACGCAVVSTNCPSGPSEILDDGLYGYLVPAGDENELVNAMLKVINGDRKYVDEAWLQKFSLETSINQLIGLIER